MEDAMDLENARKVIKAVNEKKIKIIETNVKSPSPFAFGIFIQGMSDIMKMEERLDFVKRLHKTVMTEIQSK
jgi:ATP-dependent Lhr-like helicase